MPTKYFRSQSISKPEIASAPQAQLAAHQQPLPELNQKNQTAKSWVSQMLNKQLDNLGQLMQAGVKMSARNTARFAGSVARTNAKWLGKQMNNLWQLSKEGTKRGIKVSINLANQLGKMAQTGAERVKQQLQAGWAKAMALSTKAKISSQATTLEANQQRTEQKQATAVPANQISSLTQPQMSAFKAEPQAHIPAKVVKPVLGVIEKSITFNHHLKTIKTELTKLRAYREKGLSPGNAQFKTSRALINKSRKKIDSLGMSEELELALSKAKMPRPVKDAMHLIHALQVPTHPIGKDDERPTPPSAGPGF